MALLKHENIKVLKNRLNWRKNGILNFIDLAQWFGLSLPSVKPRLQPVPCPVKRSI